MIETLPRRERDVFETLCRLEQATAASVRMALADPLSDSAVRTLLSRLEAKGLVKIERDKLVVDTGTSSWKHSTGSVRDR